MWDKHVCMNEREQGEDVRSPLFIPFVKRNTDRADDSSNQPSLRYFIWSMSKLVFSLSWIFFFKAGKLFVNMHLLRRSTDSCCQISARFFLITKEQHKCPSLLVVVTEKIKHNVQEVFFFFFEIALMSLLLFWQPLSKLFNLGPSEVCGRPRKRESPDTVQ